MSSGVLVAPALTKKELAYIVMGLGHKKCMLETGDPLYSHADLIRMDEKSRKRFRLRLADRDQLEQAREIEALMAKLMRLT